MHEDIDETKNKGKGKTGVIFVLHLILMVYSLGGILSKKASGEQFLSLRFCLYYGGVILLLVVYAFVWQQIIKRMPLSVAYANKAVTLVWGIIWGRLFFNEGISIGKVAGVIMVMAGVVLYSLADSEGTKDEQ